MKSTRKYWTKTEKQMGVTQDDLQSSNISRKKGLEMLSKLSATTLIELYETCYIEDDSEDIDDVDREYILKKIKRNVELAEDMIMELEFVIQREVEDRDEEALQPPVRLASNLDELIQAVFFEAEPKELKKLNAAMMKKFKLKPEQAKYKDQESLYEELAEKVGFADCRKILLKYPAGAW